MVIYQNDHLGTPQKLTAVNGAVVWSAKYSSFGEAEVNLSSTITNNLRFPGQYYDKETGVHYNRHRYYDPEVGRYLRSDPFGLKGGINLSSYSRNNPLKYIDPLGLWCGSGWTEWVVPDKPAGYDFSEACKQHDRCYGGENDENGNDQCGKSQEDCDRKFYEQMKEVCAKENDDELNRYVPDRPGYEYHGQSRSECERIARDYWKAVQGLGGKPYRKAREKPPCGCSP